MPDETLSVKVEVNSNVLNGDVFYQKLNYLLKEQAKIAVRVKKFPWAKTCAVDAKFDFDGKTIRAGQLGNEKGSLIINSILGLFAIILFPERRSPDDFQKAIEELRPILKISAEGG